MKEIENPNGEIKIFAGGKTVMNANENDIPNANITSAIKIRFFNSRIFLYMQVFYAQISTLLFRV